jgi:acetyl-CoA C-acetyltransferase
VTGRDAVVVDAVRTPVGRRNGGLSGVHPVDLSAYVLDALVARTGLDPGLVEDVVWGCVSQTGEQAVNVGRNAALAAGWPEDVVGMTLDRQCGSSQQAVHVAAAGVISGQYDVAVAGGVESMSRVPMGSDGGAWAQDPETAYETGFVPQGIGADLIATIEGFNRTDVDTFAAESQTRAAKAIADGAFARSVIPVKDLNGEIVLDHDEFVRAGTTPESLAGLKPSFEGIGEMGGFDAVALQKYHWVEKINHVHHAGNSSGIVDGAGLVVVGSERAGSEFGLTPRARVVATGVVGSEPTIMLTGPVPSAQKALAKAGLDVTDIDLFEVNEAFAAVVMKFMKDLKVPHEKVNVNGGAIAMGHPLGATGSMILGTLIDELERRDLRYGLATLCVGGGMGVATIVERVA